MARTAVGYGRLHFNSVYPDVRGQQFERVGQLQRGRYTKQVSGERVINFEALGAVDPADRTRPRARARRVDKHDDIRIFELVNQLRARAVQGDDP